MHGATDANVSIESPHTAQRTYPDPKVKGTHCTPLHCMCFPIVSYRWLCLSWFSLREDLHWREREHNALHPCSQHLPDPPQLRLQKNWQPQLLTRDDIPERDCPTPMVFPVGNEGTIWIICRWTNPKFFADENAECGGCQEGTLILKH